MNPHTDELLAPARRLDFKTRDFVDQVIASVRAGKDKANAAMNLFNWGLPQSVVARILSQV